MSNYQLSKPEKGRQTSRKVRTKTGREREADRETDTERDKRKQVLNTQWQFQ